MYHDYNGCEIEDLEMDNMRRDSLEEMKEKKKSLRPFARSLTHFWCLGCGLMVSLHGVHECTPCILLED